MRTTVSEIFVHGPRSSQPEDMETTPMIPLQAVEAVEGMGLREDQRYFRRVIEGTDRKRQVSLIDEATISRLERQFGPIPHACVKAQIVLSGDVFLPELMDATLYFEDGAAIVLAKVRDPCYAMDLIAPGLKDAMEHGQQGGLGRVIASGRIVVGQGVTVSVPSGAVS
jgi:hypothetical protein